MLYLIYKLLLTLIHVIYSCVETFLILWCFVRKKYETLWFKSEIKDDLYYISQCVKSIKNIPSHLAFILVSEEVISLEALANLVLWSFAAGVSILTFYDHDGKLKQVEEQLRAEVTRRRGSLDNIVWGSSPSLANGKPCNGTSNGQANGTANGFKSRPPLHILFLSREDGRAVLAKAATLIAGQEVKPDLSVEQAERAVSLAYQESLRCSPGAKEVLPVPELAVWCGELACVAGFLPWHIRVTEFLQVRSLEVSAREFVDLLQRFGQCEQRLGK